MKLTSYLPFVSRLRVSGSLPPLPHMPLYIYRDGFTFCRPTNVRYKDLPKFRIYTNIYDLVRYHCVESGRKRVEWAAIQLLRRETG